MKEKKAEAQEGLDLLSVLNGMSLEELMVMDAEIDTMIKNKQQGQRRKLYEQMQMLVQNAGYESIEEVLATHSLRRVRSDKGVKPEPRYCNPTDHGQTWSGRGRRPQWVVDYLAGGGSLHELEMAPH
ncbi:MAG: H-NS histone family protein [Magnetococcales bacterium]|nr:H-NS histone family protein [Magnetococcales bacterium]